MGFRKINFSTGEFYHIYNRGNSKQKIFLDNQDYDRFLKLLYLCNSNRNVNFREDIVDQKIDAFDFDRDQLIVSIGAWVIMSNHFHLYLTISQRSFLWEFLGMIYETDFFSCYAIFKVVYSIFSRTFKHNSLVCCFSRR